MSWQEMQTAPHDGTTIIVRYPLQGNVKRIASYNTLHKFWESNGEPFWPVQQHCQWAAIPPDVAAPSPANGAVGEMPEYIYGREAGENEKVWTERAVRTAVLAEREACAKACADSFTGFGGPIDDPAQDSILINGAIRDCITAIRART